MIEGEETSNRFLPRIRQELDKLPLTETEKDKVLPQLSSSVSFLARHGNSDRLERAGGESDFLDFETKVNGVVAHFADEGLTLEKYLKAAVRQPALFLRSPEAIVSNIEGVVNRFSDEGLTRRTYLAAALKQPQLFGQSNATIAANITDVANRFASEGLTTKDYLQAALQQPAIFARDPDTVASNITGVVSRFAGEGLTCRRYLRAALKAPSLFSQTPGTVIGHIIGVADRFKDDGLTTGAYLAVALKKPTLFTLSHETVISHIETVFSFFDRGILQTPLRKAESTLDSTRNSRYTPVLAFLMKSPTLLTLADDNFAVREVHQRLTDGPTTSALLVKSRHAVERELMQHLDHGDPDQPVPTDGFIAGAAPPTEEQARRFVLRALIHAGFIRGGSMER